MRCAGMLRPHTIRSHDRSAAARGKIGGSINSRSESHRQFGDQPGLSFCHRTRISPAASLLAVRVERLVRLVLVCRRFVAARPPANRRTCRAVALLQMSPAIPGTDGGVNDPERNKIWQRGGSRPISPRGGFRQIFSTVFTFAEAGCFFVLLPLMGGCAQDRERKVTGMLTSAYLDVGAIESALRSYERESGNFPTAEQGLKALVEAPSNPPVPVRWKQQMVRLPVDPWGNGYRYRYPGVKSAKPFDLWSRGPDERDSDDDIGNWEIANETAISE